MLALASCGGQAAPASSPASAAAGSAPPAVSTGAAAKPASSTSAAVKPAGSAAKPAASGQAAKLIVSYGELVPQSVPIFVAQDAGIYQQNGLNIDLRLIVSSAEMAALLSGETQIASAAGSQVLNAETAGADLVVTAAIAGLSPFRLYVQPSIKSVAELKGKSVGISKFGSPSETAVRTALAKNGLNPDKDVRIVEMGSTQARTAALIQGSIDAGMANPLEADKLEQSGLHSVYDLAKEKLPSAQSVVLAKRDWVNGHRDLMQRYVDAIVQAMARTRADKALTIGVMKKWFKSDDDKLMGSVYDAYTGTGLWPEVPYVTPAMFDDTKAVISARDPKMKDYDVSKLIDSSFVKSAEERGLAKT